MISFLTTATTAASLFGSASSQTLFFSGPAAPIIDLGYAQYRGIQDSKTNTNNYVGLKYANAPRFDHSTLFDGPTNGGAVLDASNYGLACPQHELVSEFAPSDFGFGAAAGLIESTPIFQKILNQGEDCLSINVQRPRDAMLKGLPVFVWIHGGGFEAGASAAAFSETTALSGAFFQGANIVKMSLDMNQPVVFASFNYRLNHFGFTASKEFAAAGLLNLGLEDQRNALRWIKKNIASFGGDPTKVTIVGESAGAYSVSAQLVAYDGNNEGLFRGAIAMSGGPLNVDGPQRQQDEFDNLVAYVGCSTATDKIACLRQAPYQKIYTQMQTINYNLGYHSLASAWTIRPGNSIMTASPGDLVRQGKIASNVSIMVGDMRDEGTIFSLINSMNLTTTARVKAYFQSIWWPKATSAQLDQLLSLYPFDPTAGSPYGTGLLYSIPLQYKRIAAITGDYSFEAQRRNLLANFPGPKWNYQIEATLPVSLLGINVNSPIPVVGSFHGFDAFYYLFNGLPATVSKNTLHIMRTWISFVNNLDPNKHGLSDLPNWPQWDQISKSTFHFQESGVNIIPDTYRQTQMEFINANTNNLKI